MLTAVVNKILPTSVVDGPGNRTAIFLQGCNIRCAYCHNPETQNLCIHCGACVPGCPTGALQIEAGKVVWHPEKCIDCDQCIQVCPHFASPKVREMTSQQVFEKVMESVPFIRGITVSGGECTLYADFMTELFGLVKAAGLGCLIDSNGTVDLTQYPELIDRCDGVMLDIKSWDSAVHTALTGFDNFQIKRNLAFLAANDKLAEVRIVCIPDMVDAPQAIEGIFETIGAKLAKTVALRLIAFRPFGVRGKLAQQPTTSPEYMRRMVALAEQIGFGNVLPI